MSEERRRGGGEDGEDGGPGLVYMPFVIMEELTDKLRLLDYDRSFLRKMNIKPISRYYDHTTCLTLSLKLHSYLFCCESLKLISMILSHS